MAATQNVLILGVDGSIGEALARRLSSIGVSRASKRDSLRRASAGRPLVIATVRSNPRLGVFRTCQCQRAWVTFWVW